MSSGDLAANGSPSVSPGDYAPSPGTCEQAVQRANQTRVQSLLRRLLHADQDEAIKIDTIRVLRRTLRELDFQLSWLTQVDFLETIERLLRNEQRPHQPKGSRRNITGPDQSWRLVHDASQLLLEAMPRLGHEVDQQLIESIVPSVVENLGHSRSELRRVSLLLLNQTLLEYPRHFQLLMRLFIDYGLTNYRNKQAQRGSILSLPLLISKQIVERDEDLGQLIRCLSELLLIDSNEKLFYSLFLAMQRIHLMLGDAKFQRALRHCEPEAVHLYKQAASRNNSLVVVSPGDDATQDANDAGLRADQKTSSDGRRESLSRQQQQQQQQQHDEQQIEQGLLEQQQARQQQHVTFERGPTGQAGESCEQSERRHSQDQRLHDRPGGQMNESRADNMDNDLVEDELDNGSLLSSSSSPSSSSSLASSAGLRVGRAPAAFAAQHADYSSEVSSTCSSDAHLVNPAHYMTKAALEGHPLDHYDEIHHVDHSNVTSLAINDFGPICNTPTTELQPVSSLDSMYSKFHTPLAAGGGHFRGGAHLAEHLSTSGGGGGGSSGGTPAGLLFSELKFGIFPRHLIQATLHAPRPADRYEAMQELMCLCRESPVNHLAILMTYFDSFMDQFLARVLLDPRHRQQPTDCKLELVAIDMIETIIIKTKVSTMQFIRPIVSLLMRSLATDAARHQHGPAQQQQQQQQPPAQQPARIYSAPASIFRENTCRVLHKMMAYLPPQHVLDSILEHKHHRSWPVREEAINRVTGALLEYDRNEFNLTKLCYHVLPMQADEAPAVRLAALECMATLAHALGPERIGSLLTAAEAVQTGCDYDGLLDAINARLQRHTLPRCQSNGVVRYALKPFLAHHQVADQQPHSSAEGGRSPTTAHLAADVRWVLESPALHHGHHSNGPASPDRANHQGEAHAHHAHHRLGVYSPPTWDERRRRCSVAGVGGLEHGSADASDEQARVNGHENHQHHHEHHHQLHLGHHHRGQQQQQQQHEQQRPQRQDSERRKSVDTRQEEPADPSGDPHRKQTTRADAAPKSSENQRRKSNAGQTNQSETIAGAGRRNSKSQSQDTSGERNSEISPPRARRQSREQKRATEASRRSNSQDSLSSSDTNKVLFQFYLGKFKQSLADPSGTQYQAVLPSDSIIYNTDINQAYELSRYQSRFQQTSSLEIDAADRPNGVGNSDADRNNQEQEGDHLRSASRDADRMSPSPVARPHADPGQQETDAGRKSSASRARGPHQEEPKPGHQHQHQQPREPSGQADLSDETSGSESPQTVREITRQQQQQPPLRSRPSIQRQTRVGDQQQAVRRRKSSPDRTERPAESITGLEASGRRHTLSAIRPLSEQDPTIGWQSRAGATEAEQSFTNDSNRQDSARGSVAHQNTSLEQGARSHGQLRRQESRATSATSPTSTTASGSSRSVPDRRGQPETRTGTGGGGGSSAATKPADDSGGSGREPRHRASSSQRRRHRLGSRSRAEGRSEHRDRPDEDGDGERPEDRQQARRRASRSQPPVGRSRQQDRAEEEPADDYDEGHEQRGRASHDDTGAATLIRINRQQGRRPAGKGLSADVSGGRSSLVSPSLANGVNIRQLLENAARLEGPFAEPQLALKVAMSALESACWSTKVEGLLALVRLVAHHPELVLAEGRLHEIVNRTAEETRNLRSSVSRAAIFALGDFCARLKRSIEPELDVIVKCLLVKSIENTAFIRDDIRRALSSAVDHLTHWRLATLLIQHGGQHKSSNVRRMASQFVEQCVERLGPAKALVGAREISHLLLPAAARFAQDQSPHTRYYGRLILSKLMHHSSFERLLRRNLSSSLYRSTVGILESIKRRGCGAPPDDN